MPELPHVSGMEAIRALERLGFVIVRQRGTLGGILRQAGVVAEASIEALSR